MPKPYDHHAWVERLDKTIKERGQAQGWSFLALEPEAWAPITRPLAKTTVALVSSCGAHLKSQEPFDAALRGDLVFYEVPTTVEPSELMISHPSYDHSDADRDINCVLPYERLREFVGEGRLGALSPRAYTCMGRIPNASLVQRTLAPQIAERVAADKVDLVLLTGG